MIIKETRRLIQKFLALALLLGCLGLVSINSGTKASACSPSSLLPCCSYCDSHPGSQLCSHGCLDGCRSGE